MTVRCIRGLDRYWSEPLVPSVTLRPWVGAGTLGALRREQMSCAIRELRETDFTTISARVDEWLGRPVRSSLLRLFFEHFRPMSRVAEQGGDLVGFIVTATA
jgi:hypothetical protein